MLKKIVSELLIIIKKDEKRAPGELIGALTNLDSIVAHHRPELPSKLVHFLEKRSYEKALAFIEDQEAQKL